MIRDLDLLPQLLQSDWSGVFLQRFFGDLTLVPKSRPQDWFHILDDPSRKDLERMILFGERTTWPTIHFVHNRAKIEHAIQRGRAEVRAAMSRERPNNDASTGNLQVNAQMPIESDADTAIALRARQNGAEGSSGNRRRRLDRLPMPPKPSAVPEVEMPRSESPTELPRSNTAPSFGDTFRQMRSSPLAAFGAFRNRPGSRSRRSISAWLGGVSDSSQSDDDLEPEVRDWRNDALQGNDVFLDSGEVSAAAPPDSADEPQQDGSSSDQ